MGWPEWIMIGIFFSWMVCAVGKCVIEKNRDAIVSLLATIIVTGVFVGLLTWGGFWQ